MSSFYCVTCGNEFPAEGARLKPEWVGMVLFVTIGAILIAGGIVGLVLFLPNVTADDNLKMTIYSGASILFGALSFGFGMKLRKGVKAFCPACGKPQGVPSDSGIANEVRRRKAAGK